MKIVCDACQAKYSISDDKVQGKVFKIRCKKCSNIIVVRGGANAAEAAPAPQEKDTRVYDYGYDGAGAGGDEAVWHLVINQDQVGPMTVAEVQQRFAAGECDGETFAWREGFADWLPLAQVDTFTALVASGSTTSAQSGGAGAAAIGAMFGSGDDAGGSTRNDDLFSAASARGGGHHEEDDGGGGGDLFGSKQPAAAAASASAGNSKLRGERNENSVLFSLNNLAQLASDKPAISAPSSQAGHATGAAGGEGSGLIDIRSMASAYMGGSGAAMGKPAHAASIGSIDDLPVFGGGGFSEPAVIVPSVGRSRDNRLLYLMIGAVALLAVVAVVMVVILMRGPKKDTNVVASADNKADTDKDKDKADKPTTDTGSAAAPAAAADTGSAAAAPAPGAAPTPEAAQTPTHTAPAPAPHHTATTAPSHVEHAEHAEHEHEHVAHSAPKADPTPPPTKADSGGGGCDEVSCVINSYAGACCAKFHHAGGGGGGAAKPSGGADLPDALDRGMISSAIANVKARVTSCGEKTPSVHGKVKVHVKVGGDGRVSNVTIETTPDPGLGSCVQSAVQRASFAKTQSGGSFSYPFVF
ncbi:MAG TPA: GYF domain-containing protein [Kofleriaceae bacterium]|jgi:predicted Zn finger-like uncharacterized protein